jgi:hypothetical protein
LYLKICAVEDDATYFRREGGGSIMVDFVKFDSLSSSNVDVGSATLITWSCDFGDDYLRDVGMMVCVHIMMDD